MHSRSTFARVRRYVLAPLFAMVVVPLVPNQVPIPGVGVELGQVSSYIPVSEGVAVADESVEEKAVSSPTNRPDKLLNVGDLRQIVCQRVGFGWRRQRAEREKKAAPGIVVGVNW